MTGKRAEMGVSLDNAITPLRLGLALAVVLSHAFKSGGFGADPLEALTGGQLQIGTASVIAFFGLSGWLLADTRTRRSRPRFAWHRILRIVPGLTVCVAVIWIVVVPVAVNMGGTRPAPNMFAWWALQILVPHSALPELSELYGHVAMPGIVDASLWTLGVEAAMYAVLFTLPGGVAGPGTAVVAALPLGLLIAAGDSWILQLPVAFGVGALLSGRSVPGSLAAVSVVVLAASSTLHILPIIAALAVPILTIWAGLALPLRWHADLSYGVYIYAWPVQQLAAMAGLSALGYPTYLAICLAAVLPVAFLSWSLIESPALKLRGLGQPPAEVIDREDPAFARTAGA